MGNLESQFGRTVGGTPDQRKEIDEKMKQAHETPFFPFDKKLELPKTEKERETISWALKHAEAYIQKRYGVQFPPLSPEKIHMASPEGLHAMHKARGQDDWAAFTFPTTLDVYVDRSESATCLAVTIAHERFHASEHKALRAMPSGNAVLYRAGIMMSDKSGKPAYFRDFEEAIIGHLTKDFFYQEIRKSPQFKKEIAESEKIKRFLLEAIRQDMAAGSNEYRELPKLISPVYSFPSYRSILAVIDGPGTMEEKARKIFSSIFDPREISTREHPDEWNRLDAFLGEMVQKSAKGDGKVKNKEQAFELFARSNFTGNILPLVRTIKKLFPEESMRDIAKKS